MALRVTDEEYAALRARPGLARPATTNPPSPATNKYHARRTIVDGITFASTGEANRYCELGTLQAAGAIANLRLQVPYDLVVNGVNICRYVADFVYTEDGDEIVEDFKGVRTPEYRIKKLLMAACYGITIRETAHRRSRTR